MAKKTKDKDSSLVSKILKHPKAILYTSVLVLYAIATMYYYVGDSFVNCNDTMPSGIGDETAGLVWLNSVSNHRPWWGFTQVSNFPFGEQLGQPFHILGATTSVPFWLIAKAVGPVCSYTVLTSIGFVFSAMVMFLFILWLTRKTAVAIIAGYAVAFTPYIQYKTGVHPSYVFEGVFILFAWLFLLFWKNPTWKKAVGLGALAASFFYTDPYFILLGAILGGGLLVFATIYWLVRVKKMPALLQRWRLIGLSFLTLIALILPIVYIQLKYSAEINNVVSGSRSDINTEAEVYGARPWEYLLPSQHQPVLGQLLGPDFYNRYQHGSNIAETQINISLALLAISMSFVALLIYRRQKGDVLSVNWKFQNYSVVFLVTIFGGVGILAFLFSLAPHLYGLVMPSELLIHITSMWRVLARLQVIVNISLVTIAALGLTVLLRRYSSVKAKSLIIGFIALCLVFEYQIFFPVRDTWTYKDAAPAYFWLKSQNDISAIAEYPLDEPAKSDFTTFYFTYQIIHGKKLLNANSPVSPQSVLRNGLRDLDDPQTVPILRSLGIQAVLVHNKNDPGTIPGLQQIQTGQTSSADTDEDYAWAYRVLPGLKQDFLLAPGTGFNDLKVKSAIDVGYQTSSSAKMIFIKVAKGNTSPKKSLIGIDVHSATKDARHLRISQSGQILWEGPVEPTEQRITFTAVPDPKEQLLIEVSGTGADKGVIMKRISNEEQN